MRRRAWRRCVLSSATLLVAVVTGTAAGLVAAPAASATTLPAAGAAPGTVAHPIGRVHLEEFEWFNVLQVVDASNRIVRSIPVAGNPYIAKPDVCVTDGRIRVDYDYTGQWKLNYFTRLCAGRGLGTHAIPVGRSSGLPDMSAADLGKAPNRGAPLSHGCLRMSTADAAYIYDTFSVGVPIYFVKTPWRPVAPWNPAVVRASPRVLAATVAWTPALARGSAVTSYVVSAPGVPAVTVPGSATSAVLSGLPPGVPVSVVVVARSAAGTSTAGVAPPVIALGLSGRPAQGCPRLALPGVEC